MARAAVRRSNLALLDRLQQDAKRHVAGRVVRASAAVSRQIRRAVAPARYVTLKLAEALTGYTAEAMPTKIKRGVWLQGHEFIRAPDGRTLVDMEGYTRWAAGQRGA